MNRAALLWSGLIAGCSEYDVGHGAETYGDGAPDIAVDPTVVAFGASSAPITRSVRVLNVGTAELEVSSVRVEPSGAFSVPDPAAAFRLVPGASTTQDVSWTPSSDRDVATLVLSSNDRDTPELEVPLSGEGLFGELTIEPDPLVFEAITVSCTLTSPVTLRNTGDGPLTVNGLSVTGTSFVLADVPVPFDLAPDQAAAVDVSFVPAIGDETLTGALAVDSSDRRGLRTSDLEGASIARVHHTDTFEQADGSRIDMSIFVDTSCSMADDAANLAANFDAFLEALLGGPSDFQILVVTKDDGCHNQAIITPATPDPEGTFTLAVNELGSSYSEAGLIVTSHALGKTGPGMCNEGFLRFGVPTISVMLSDEPEQSPDDWSSYVATMQSFAPDVAISGVVGQVDSTCGALNGTGYHAAIEATGGVDLDICDIDWGESVYDILATAGPSSSFLLNATPDPLTIAVTVDQIPIVVGWFYDEDSNSVAFDPYTVPEGGSTIVVDYDEPAVCP